MVTFLAKEKENAGSYTLAWRPGYAGTSRLQPTDLPLKLLERETAMKRATADPLKSSSTVINSAQLRAQRAEKGF